MKQAHTVGIQQGNLVFHQCGTGALEFRGGEIGRLSASVEVDLRQVLALEFLDQADTLEMVGASRSDRHIVHPGREGAHFFREAGATFSVSGVFHEVLPLQRRILQSAMVGAVAEHLAEQIFLEDDRFHAGFDVFHISPLEALLVAEKLGNVTR